MPEIRVLGENAFWNPELEETADEDDTALANDPEAEDETEDEERQVSALDLGDTADEQEEVCPSSTQPR